MICKIDIARWHCPSSDKPLWDKCPSSLPFSKDIWNILSKLCVTVPTLTHSAAIAWAEQGVQWDCTSWKHLWDGRSKITTEMTPVFASPASSSSSWISVSECWLVVSVLWHLAMLSGAKQFRRCNPGRSGWACLWIAGGWPLTRNPAAESCSPWFNPMVNEPLGEWNQPRGDERGKWSPRSPQCHVDPGLSWTLNST